MISKRPGSCCRILPSSEYNRRIPRLPCVVLKASVMQAQFYSLNNCLHRKCFRTFGKMCSEFTNSLKIWIEIRARGGWKKIKWHRQYSHKIGNFKTIFLYNFKNHLIKIAINLAIRCCQVEIINSFSLLNYDKFCTVSKDCLLKLYCQRSTHTRHCTLYGTFKILKQD